MCSLNKYLVIYIDMSDVDENKNKLDELMNKLTRCNKNIKIIMETVAMIDQKLGEKSDAKNEKNESKPIGRPVGTWENKRDAYFEMLKTGRVKNPKPETLKYYKIFHDEDNGNFMLIS